jgi:hypothetical protein
MRPPAHQDPSHAYRPEPTKTTPDGPRDGALVGPTGRIAPLDSMKARPGRAWDSRPTRPVHRGGGVLAAPHAATRSSPIDTLVIVLARDLVPVMQRGAGDSS